jgi:hypothetical protein
LRKKWILNVDGRQGIMPASKDGGMLKYLRAGRFREKAPALADM